MSDIFTYNKLKKKVLAVYKEDWCQRRGVSSKKRPVGFITQEQFDEELFQNPEFVRQYTTDEEYELYLKALEVRKLIYVPQRINWLKDSDEIIARKMNYNYNNLFRLDSMAQKQESLVGRFLVVPVPESEQHQPKSGKDYDSLAFYQIIMEYDDYVDISVCLNLGEDWDIPEWGKRAKIGKEVALENIEHRGKYIGLD